jgi:hypothetical protein
LFSGRSPAEAAQRFWEKALGPEKARKFSRRVDLSVETIGEGRLARAHLEMPAWFSFRYSVGVKRQFEVTRKCRFACSR